MIRLVEYSKKSNAFACLFLESAKTCILQNSAKDIMQSNKIILTLKDVRMTANSAFDTGTEKRSLIF